MFPGKRTCLICLVIIVTAVPLLRWLTWSEFYPQGRPPADEILSYIESLPPSPDPGDREFIEEQAQGLAELLFDDPSQSDQFAEELVELYSETQGVDFILIYNSAGVGYASLEDDPEWKGVMDGVQSVLSDLGYTSIVVEHRRIEDMLLGFLWELREQMAGYPTEAPELMAEIAFLTRYDQDLRVIITGRSTAEIFANEVMRLLEDNDRVYGIQAGRPFWYRDVVPQRTLLINDNGIFLDTLSYGDIISIAFGSIISSPFAYNSLDGGVKVTIALMKAPGHDYDWEFPGVHSRIEAFLEENFGGED